MRPPLLVLLTLVPLPACVPGKEACGPGTHDVGGTCVADDSGDSGTDGGDSGSGDSGSGDSGAGDSGDSGAGDSGDSGSGDSGAGDSGDSGSGDSGAGDSGDSGAGDSGAGDSGGDPDEDRDGYAASVDCNDADPTVHPGAVDDPCDTIDQDCDGTVPSPDPHATHTCVGNDAWWADECGTATGIAEVCGDTSGCSAGACTMHAQDETALPTTCDSAGRENLTATAVSVSSASTDPQVEITWEKCSGTAFSDTKTCDVRIDAATAKATSRTTFTWKEGEYTAITTVRAWDSAATFAAADCDSVVELYLTCDIDRSVAYYTSGGAVFVAKRCP